MNLSLVEKGRGAAYKPIEDYGVIGDLHTVALVAKDGSIDWCCLPHFDSPSVFAAILDARKGGYFKIAPVQKTVQKQMYFPETCVLITRFLSRDGVGEVMDFMPIQEGLEGRQHIHQIVRRVRVVRGQVKFRLECFPAFDYARARHTLHRNNDGFVFSTPACSLGLSSPVKLHPKKNGVVAEFTLKTGKEATFVLRQSESGNDREILVPRFNGGRVFDQTVSYWRRWIAGCRYQGRWREMVQRSALTLKLLTFAPTGAIVASPTTSLPEAIGGQRNWDYRYTWIRDAAFTIYAFLRLGMTNEAERFVQWLEARAQEEEKDGSLQIMYGINGEHELPEKILKHLEGYAGSAPVRIGNAAHKQLQMDIYGELMDSIYLSNKYSRPISTDLWRHLRGLLNYVCDHWQEKDEGIWEVRGGQRHFVSSKMMCWVALDRGLRLAQKRSFPGDENRWHNVRNSIYEEIMTKGWRADKKSFVQHYETSALDASNLLMPLVFFISANDPKMQSTMNAIQRSLMSDSLVYRYRVSDGAADGLEGDEGTFSMCTFWMVECLARSGRLNEARYIFEKMHSYANHLGLYSEQIGHTGEALGNFPQAFTHLSLISAAFNLDRALDGGGQYI